MKQTIPITICAAAVVMLLAAPLSAQFTTSITVPGHSEEALTWCGAAVGQMIVGAYPSSPCTVLQADVWASIQANKAEAGWDTDPAGLAKAMMDPAVCTSSAHWVTFSNANAQSLMYSVAYWMKVMHYAAAVVLDTNGHNAIAAHKEHWVVVRSIETNVDPTTTSTVTLQSIDIIDPSPASLGDPPLDRHLTGPGWYLAFKTVTIPGGYSGKYVADIEPPERSGRAIARELPRTGTRITAERALAAARRAAIDLRRVPAFREIGSLQPQTPLLVNPDGGAYYLVPFAAAGKAPTMAVLINGYSNDFMEAARFKARAPLPEREAIARAQRFAGIEQPRTSKAVLVSAPEEGSPYFPSWRVSIDGEELSVDVAGNVRGAARRR